MTELHLPYRPQAVAATCEASENRRPIFSQFVTIGEVVETLEGPAFQRHVVIRFPDLARARACFDSPEYQEARARRNGACEAHIVIVEGAPPS